MRKPESWEVVFLDMAFAISQRSKDASTQCGAVIVDKNKVIVSCGFNGPPPQINDELVPWDKRPEKYVFIIHAEENAMWFADRERMKGSTIYVTNAPCADCMLRLIRNGIKRVVIPKCHKPYQMGKYQVSPVDVMNAQIPTSDCIRVETVQYKDLSNI